MWPSPFRGIDDDYAVGAFIDFPAGIMLFEQVVTPLLDGFRKRQFFGFRRLRRIAPGLEIIGRMREGVGHGSRRKLDGLSLLDCRASISLMQPLSPDPE